MVHSEVIETCFFKLLCIVAFSTVSLDKWSIIYMFINFFNQLTSIFVWDLNERKHSQLSLNILKIHFCGSYYCCCFSYVQITILLALSICPLNHCIKCGEHLSCNYSNQLLHFHLYVTVSYINIYMLFSLPKINRP